MRKKGLNVNQKKPTSQATKGLIIEWTFAGKSPLTPLCQRGELFLPLAFLTCHRQAKGGQEGFYKLMS
jgi:hypothetical protein